MRTFLLAAFIFSCIHISTAQIPAGYYDSTYNGAVPKTCADLKTALFKIITKDTTYVAYNSANGSYDTQDGVNHFDVHRNDDNTADIIWDMYTDNPNGPELYTFTAGTNQCGSSFPPQVGACYNREHAFPRAWFGDDFHVRGELHNIFATDAETNARHANWPYAEVGSASWSSPAGAKLGSCSFPGYSGTVFEVIDEYKGDFARTMFFMVTAYENSMPAWKNFANADSVLDGTTWPSLDPWAVQQWYKWHVLDPVSQKEIVRNDSVFGVQGNRNPFIDHPEYVALIWQCTGLLPVTITDFSAVRIGNNVYLQWNVTQETNTKYYYLERSTDGITFNTVDALPARHLPAYNITDHNLPLTATAFYRLKIMDTDGRSTYSKTITVKPGRNNRDISIYPNPAVNEISIALQQPATGNVVIKINDIMGRELLRQNIPSGSSGARIRTNDLPAGRYFVMVTGNSFLLYDSFVIIR